MRALGAASIGFCFRVPGCRPFQMVALSAAVSSAARVSVRPDSAARADDHLTTVDIETQSCPIPNSIAAHPPRTTPPQRLHRRRIERFLPAAQYPAVDHAAAFLRRHPDRAVPADRHDQQRPLRDRPTLEQVIYRDQLHVDSTGPALPLADQVRAAQQVRPDLTVAAVRPASEPGETTRVLFSDPSLGESERTAVFIDPATAASTRESVAYGSSSALPVRTWISQLHRHLHLGEPGRIYSKLAASWLWIIALGGVVLWVQRYRTQRARNRQAARLLTPDHTARGRNRTLGWHGVTGMWIAVGLVFLSATGLTWSKYAGENIGELRTALSWTTPTLDKT